jgi:urease accessory protein
LAKSGIALAATAGRCLFDNEEETVSLSVTRKLLSATSLLSFGAPVWAHAGHDLLEGYAGGFVHPLTGSDHVLMMLSVGLWAVRLGGVPRRLLPSAFLIMMSLGAVSAFAGLVLPAPELFVALSLVVMGVLVASRHALKLIPALVVVGFFALFHGYVHAREIGHAGSALSYALGFLTATAMLQGLGILAGVALHRRCAGMGYGVFGAFCASLGVYLLAAG